MAGSLKILFNGSRSAYQGFSNECEPTKIEPPTFSKVYVIVGLSKASSYSKGFVQKQIEKLIDDRIPLKESNSIFRVHRTTKRAFVTIAEYWNTREQQKAQAQWEFGNSDAMARSLISNYHSVAEKLDSLENILLKHPPLMQKYKPYLAALWPAKYQFTQDDRTSLSFPIHVSKLKEVRAFATAKRFSFVVDELDLWPKEAPRWSYTQTPPGIGNRVVVTFSTPEPKSLVFVRLKAIDWLEETSS